MKKLAVVLSHPIQYYAPWFRYISNNTEINLKVFYLWDSGVSTSLDRGFGESISWDIPLLDGYKHHLVKNISNDPGTHHFSGLQNPNLFTDISEFKPQSILLMNYNYQSTLSLIYDARKSGLPLIFRGDSHRLFPQTGAKEFIKRQLISFLFRQFSACLYVGAANKRYFQYHRVADDKLFYTPHAIDNERFVKDEEKIKMESNKWRDELGIPRENTVILFAGKFEDKKCPLDLLTAFTEVDIEQTSLLFVGNGKLKEQMEAGSRENPNVFFAPFQNQSQMPKVYAAADLLVLPSYGRYETWGLCINEAMCLSTAIIASSHVGCAENLVSESENGLIFKAGDVDQLKNALVRATEDRTRLDCWRKRSRELINTHTYRQATDGLVSALNKVT